LARFNQAETEDMMKTKKMRFITLVFVLITGFILTVPGCKEFNDDPVERTDVLRIDLKQIQQQLGINSGSSDGAASVTNLPGLTDATNPVKGLIIGVMLVTSRNSPYTSDVAMTEAVVENLTDELTNSQQFIVTLQLPTSQEYVEIRSPKKDPTSGGLQIVAAAVDFAIEEIAQVGESEHDNSLLYIGFIERFIEVSEIGDSALSDTMTMRRACLNNETIKGCATFPDKLSENPVVTTAVEILGVRFNDEAGETIEDYSSGNFYGKDEAPSDFPFPIKVWDSSWETIGKNVLKNARTAITADVGGASNLINLTVITTHSKNTDWESDACRTFWATDVSLITAAEIDAMIQDSTTDNKICDIQAYKIPISGE